MKPNTPLWVENNPNASRGDGGDVGVEMKVVFKDGDGDGVERVTVLSAMVMSGGMTEMVAMRGYDGDDKDGGCGDGVRRGGCWLELAGKLAGKRGAPEI
ncbi:hypothetical protein Tco_1059807 [Tanacetum coccineum]